MDVTVYRLQMRRRSKLIDCLITGSLAVLLFAGASPAIAQRRGGTAVQSFPTPPPDDIAPNSQQSQTPIKTETIVVPVRVVVRDAQGHAVGNLQKQDFKLFQDGK